MSKNTPNRRRAALTTGVVATAAAAALALSPVAAFAATPANVAQNGGAARSIDDSTQLLLDSVEAGPAKNVILLIGDGMGDSEITSARNYAHGAGGTLPGIDALPLTGQYTTYSVYRDGANKGKPDYVPDSAATGSAWATGTKTYDNAISVDVDGVPQDTLLEIAKANGKKTGNVSTAELQDATPAVQAAHVAARSCYGPDSVTQCGADALDQGGLGSISEQIIGTRADLTLGGGATSFGQSARAGQWQGDTLFAQAQDRGYQVVRDAAGLDALTTADQAQPVLGTFTDGNFPTRYAATTATVGGADLAPQTCQPNPARLSTGLSLQSLTEKSIDLLDTGDQGFFLQVEGASIDKRDHSADACGQIGEVLDLDEAVQSALAFAKADGNTMVIVTADHAHTSQIVDSTPPATLSTALTTVDGTTMKIAYGTAAAGGSQQHTGTQLRVAGYGPGAANVVGLIDQTDNFFTIVNALQLDRDLDGLSAAATISAPTEVAPGAEFPVSTAGLAGDRQVTGTLDVDGTVTDLGIADVVDGVATYTVTAPTEPGSYTITLTGTQSGTTLATTVAVVEGAVTPAPTTPPAAIPGDGSSAGGAGTAGNGSGPLAFTGSDALPALLLALMLAGTGAALVLRRRHRAASVQDGVQL
ncbi:alkaline phosphatase [Frigoribacterium sp. PhB118]|uniref:alkaline phosphatase n=1 Tax=Frigoribacterium sp. PhB118 TaxID=2485175 RepID=UPI000FC26B47|nr:alkaline phosphatase [Frigoribacterium sp. PhB118]ROS48335.1 alkaline phosphatase [Frigoribacterium sp. PhB118]